MDIATITSLVSSLKVATDITKFIRESDLSVQRAELKLKLAELIEALADAKMNAADVKQEILDRDETIRRLQDEIDTESSLTWKQPYYFSLDENSVEHQFCQKCYDSQKKLSRLHTDGLGAFNCTVCSSHYLSNDRTKIDAEAIRVKKEAARENSKPISVVSDIF
jgi:hypothetical protein